jgi:hypothetical protein
MKEGTDSLLSPQNTETKPRSTQRHLSCIRLNNRVSPRNDYATTGQGQVYSRKRAREHLECLFGTYRVFPQRTDLQIPNGYGKEFARQIGWSFS